jgi:hypothetical protein
MPGVFISYRREDSSGYAGRLFDILSGRFGRQNTFMDLDTIQGGDDFTAVIEEKIRLSDVLVAVIGTHWLTIADKNGARRLDTPGDFVRLEIGRALARGIRVIPVLVGGASLPREDDLPEDLRALCARQAVEVRDAHFHSDAEQLIKVLHNALHGFGFRRQWALLLSGIAVALVVVAILLLRHSHPNTQTVSPPAVTQPVAQRMEPSVSAVKEPVPSVIKSASVAGKWNATVKYDWGDTYQEVFEFEVDGNELSGTASFLGAGRGLVDGKIEGDRISFTTKSFSTISSDDKTYEDKHQYKGVVENGSIRFTMMTDSNMESHVPIHFIASKVKAPSAK